MGADFVKPSIPRRGIWMAAVTLAQQCGALSPKRKSGTMTTKSAGGGILGRNKLVIRWLPV
jgi:hypothetical protein